ncbi:MAG: FAD-binding oxidoreductase [bacterium]|nr:FAD-binding oxidoreductase [bacterium]
MKAFVDLLQEVCKGEVKEDERTRSLYARDASLFEVKPRAVIFPSDVEDIKHLVSFVNERKDLNLSLTCRGGGSDMTGGPLSESIVLDMNRSFQRIKEIGEDTVIVEPGLWYRDLEKELDRKNLLLPCYPASKHFCTVGGMVANNAGGEKSLLYGKTDAYVTKLKAVLADGNEYEIRPLFKQELEEKMKLQSFEGDLYRNMWQLITGNKDVLAKAKPNVSKNSSGYALWNVWNGEVFDLTKLFTGSQGTLGIITEITFRLVKKTKERKLLVVFLPSLDPLTEISKPLLALKPESLELYDDQTLKMAVKFFLDFRKILKLDVLSLLIRFLPEFFMVLQGKSPKLIVLAEFTGTTKREVENLANKAQEAIQPFGVTSIIAKDEGEAQKYFAIRRESFNLLRKHVKGMRTANFIEDVIVRSDRLEEFLPRFNKILSEYPEIIHTLAGHLGDGNLHMIPLMNLADPKVRGVIPKVADRIFKLTLEFGGSFSAEHGDGIIRTPYLEMMFGKEVCELFAKVKTLFDPSSIFNPGKKVGGSLEYAMSHIAPH